MNAHYDDYVSSKIQHLKRVGLIVGNHDGRGLNGGACPTHLYKTQKEEFARTHPQKKSSGDSANEEELSR